MNTFRDGSFIRGLGVENRKGGGRLRFKKKIKKGQMLFSPGSPGIGTSA